jgi:hypothetical protein
MLYLSMYRHQRSTICVAVMTLAAAFPAVLQLTRLATHHLTMLPSGVLLPRDAQGEQERPKLGARLMSRYQASGPALLVLLCP